MNRLDINKEVAVTALYFRGSDFKTFPKRMEYDGNTYTFANSGLQYRVRRGESLVRLFDVTDGAATYRLKCDDVQSTWTLVAITHNV